jgi:serine/threonine protein kinase
MGDVYAVEHITLHHKYAAKILRADHATDARVVDRMRLEAEALAKLDNARVVQIQSYELTPAGLPFIVMELLEGTTVRDLLMAEGTLPLNMALFITFELLCALSEVHRIGIVHRDIKPSNLFLHRYEGGRIGLKMLDFGVARVLPGSSGDAPLPLVLPTANGLAVGTPLFMSPEAARGQKVDVRSDVYSAALILYNLVAGRGPYDDLVDADKILSAHASLPPPPPSQFAKAPLPRNVEQAIMKGLAKDPNDRFETATLFAECIHSYLYPEDANGKSVGPVSERPSAEPVETAALPTGYTATISRYRNLGLFVVLMLFTMVISVLGIRFVLR